LVMNQAKNHLIHHLFSVFSVTSVVTL